MLKRRSQEIKKKKKRNQFDRINGSYDSGNFLKIQFLRNFLMGIDFLIVSPVFSTLGWRCGSAEAPPSRSTGGAKATPKEPEGREAGCRA
jgi:hypothetical protein